ncbi:MAG: hypothetical protein CL920_37295 [Deltaproteobacteria bacterium]|nr:hypothetical protein [Deltaproteobacteria bacterium]MBU54388.1 hypothetical protein [Deltaproteobacteria bacterium]|tara:strand:- start:68 stop:577 length:510 start_codon:yes stop_codon:yes gene_type:complete
MSKRNTSAELRTLLANTNHDDLWRRTFWDLLYYVDTSESPENIELWRRYCEEHKELIPSPLFSFGSLDELEEMSEYAPFISFGLDLSYTDCRDDELKYIIESPILKLTKFLDLRGNLLGHQSAELLANSLKLQHLEELQISDNPINEHGYELIANSPYLCDAIKKQYKS